MYISQDVLELQSIFTSDSSLNDLKYQIEYDLKKGYIKGYDISDNKISITGKNNLTYEIDLDSNFLPINNECVFLSTNYPFLDSQKEKYISLNTSVVCKNSINVDTLKEKLEKIKEYSKKNNIKYSYEIIKLDNSYVLEYSINGNLNSIYF